MTQQNGNYMTAFRVISLVALFCSSASSCSGAPSHTSTPVSKATAPIETNSYLLAAWKNVGRIAIAEWFGISYNESDQRYYVDPAWKGDPNNLGMQAYYAEERLRPAIHFACTTNQNALIDELAGFFNVFYERLVSIGDLKQLQIQAGMPSAIVLQSSLDSALTVPFIGDSKGWANSNGANLVNSQFFHAPSQLINCISALPPNSLTGQMQIFVNKYVPVIVNDQILRILYVDSYDESDLLIPHTLIDLWQAIADGSLPAAERYGHYRVFDWYLWLIGSSSEILGAYHHNSQLIPLNQEQIDGLKKVVATGIAMVQARRTLHTVKNWAGQTVQSSIYFLGDEDKSEDMRYADYYGTSFPTAEQAAPPTNGSWDISHSYRIPVLFESLIDNSEATSVNFPTPKDIELIINQYVYGAFKGDLNKPLFNNFLDGNDGWYRVGYHGPDFGYPPASNYDSAQATNRPSLLDGALMGWGQLAPYHFDLKRLQQAILALASTVDPDQIAFRDRYYKRFYFVDPKTGQMDYSFLLFSYLAESTS